MAGIPIAIASPHTIEIIAIVICLARLPWYEWSFLSGLTIAKKRSPDRAVRVNTETPMDTSLKNSEVRQMTSPHSHEG